MSEKIVVDKLTKYYGTFKALSNVSFNVNKGEVFGLIGPNGAGKSTTMRSMLNFIFPSKGSITINGLDSKKDYLKIRSFIGYLPGEFTTYENMNGQEYLKHILHLRKIPQNENYVKKLAKRFDLDLSKKAKNLSKGNKQKIGIIQAFCHDPEILILDEPTSGLDPLKQQVFDDLILEYKEKGKTIFISSHVLPEVEMLCDRVAIIKDGRIVAENTMSKLKSMAMNRFEVIFKNEIREKGFGKSIGVKKIIRSGDKYIFDIEGDVNKFIKKITENKVLSFKSIEPDLEEIFLSFYKKRGKDVK
ncbi:MAG: ABC transporter ATP-binding protein [Chloroflexota bacterium]|nr:ABC transporter ATP-binding protein [Chloroflexota bacterium]